MTGGDRKSQRNHRTYLTARREKNRGGWLA
jgi:hypothetical protein